MSQDSPRYRKIQAIEATFNQLKAGFIRKRQQLSGMEPPHYQAGHEAKLLINGESFFPALINAINNAQIEIILETYIFAADKTGESITQALIQAATRGVHVYLLLDGYGAEHYPKVWSTQLLAAGAYIEWFRPPHRGLKFRRRYLRRLHRKVTTIDGIMAFVGGINILDDWDEGFSAPRLDYCIQLQGPLVPRIRTAQLALWRQVCWSQFKTQRWHPFKPQMTHHEADTELAFLLRDNFKNRHTIEAMYLHAIKMAKHHIIIANAYFLPGWRFRNALFKAQARGVKVDLLLPGKADHPWMQAASRYLYPEFLQQNINVHEYQPSQLHAKVMVMDGVWATVGSSNIDPLSLLMAREANIAIQDSKLAQQLQDHLLQAIHEHSLQITPNTFKPGFWQRAWTTIGFVAARWALRLFYTGRSGRYWE